MVLNGDSHGDAELVRDGISIPLNNGSYPFFRPLAINEHGRIAGYASVGPGEGLRAAFYDDGEVQLYPSRPYPRWGEFKDVRAVDINDAGETLVNVTKNDSSHVDSFIYRGTDEVHGPIWIDLTGLSDGDFVALAINDLGQVVGTDYLYDGSELRRLTELIGPQSGWSQLDGVDINDLGQIVGQGMLDGRQRAFLMTPMSVPEPAPIALLGSVIAWAAWKRFFRQRLV